MSDVKDSDLLQEIKTAADAQGRAWEEFKKVNDENQKKHDAVLDDKLSKIEKELSGASETLNQKLVRLEQEQKAAKEAADTALAESKERIAQLETQASRPRAGSNADKEAKRAYFEHYVRGAVGSILYGRGQISDDQKDALAQAEREMKDLSVGSDTTGGFLAPAEYVREILKGVVEYSPFRMVASVRQTSSRSLMIPKRTATAAAGWTAELATRSESTNPAFGMEEIPTHEMYAMIDISEQNLEDSVFNLEQFVRDEAVEQFGVTEGTAFIDGSGVGRPEGILDNTDVGETVSGSAATIADSAGTADGIIDLFHDLKTAYARNGTWLLNRNTMGSVRKLKDANDQYIWMAGLADLRPNTILGAPYVEMPDMPDEAANAYPMAFGDFRRAYTVVDRVAMSMLRDPFTQAAGGLVRFWFRRRVGGQVVIAEAIRKLKCST